MKRLLLCFFAWMCFGNVGYGEVTNSDTFVAICGLFPDGQFNEQDEWNIPDIYYIDIPLDDANAQLGDSKTWGTLTYYSGPDGRKHDCGKRYNYAVARIAENWEVEHRRRDKDVVHESR